MSMFKNLTTAGLEQAEDRIGGGGVLETGIYTGKIKVAYAGKSVGGAQSITLILDLAGREYRETIYITNKAGENFFLNKSDPTKKVPLPGFTLIDHICLLTTEEPLSEQDVEEKVVKIYNFDERKEVPTNVPVLVDLIGKEVSVAIVKELVNKNAKNSSGDYAPTAETREQNVIDKAFHPESKLTVVEALNGDEEGAFWDVWLEKNKGKTKDKRTIREDGAAGSSGGRPTRQPTPPSGETPAPRKNLFGKK